MQPASWLTSSRNAAMTVLLQEVEPGPVPDHRRAQGHAGGGKSLMLNGHIDINPIANQWQRDPWTPTIEGDRLYGAGIRNMKSGVAAMVEAAEAVRLSSACR